MYIDFTVKYKIKDRTYCLEYDKCGDLEVRQYRFLNAQCQNDMVCIHRSGVLIYRLKGDEFY